MPLLIRNCHGILRLKLTIRKEACDEIEFWEENVDSLNFHSLGHLCNRLLSLSILMHPITPVVLSSIITISVVSIVHNGSKVKELQSLALSIFNVCAHHQLLFT